MRAIETIGKVTIMMERSEDGVTYWLDGPGGIDSVGTTDLDEAREWAREWNESADDEAIDDDPGFDPSPVGDRSGERVGGSYGNDPVGDAMAHYREHGPSVRSVGIPD